MRLSVQPKKLIFLLSAFLLVACGNKKDKIHLSAEAQSSLVLNQLSVESVTPLSLNALHTSVITHKRFLIKACFVDGATLRAYPKTPDSLNAITANAKWQRAS